MVLDTPRSARSKYTHTTPTKYSKLHPQNCTILAVYLRILRHTSTDAKNHSAVHLPSNPSVQVHQRRKSHFLPDCAVGAVRGAEVIPVNPATPPRTPTTAPPGCAGSWPVGCGGAAPLAWVAAFPSTPAWAWGFCCCCCTLHGRSRND